MKDTKANLKKRTYFGESIAKPLVQRLNAMNAKAVRLHFPVFALFDSSDRYYSARSLAGREILKNRANKALREFKFSPLVEDVNEVWTIRWIPGTRDLDGEAVYQWLKLAELGLLPRLKRCTYLKCRKFFFAKFSHTCFHSIKCRNAEAKENPERREKRRAYERRYYRDKNAIWK